jgi:hypothetical protein
MAKCKTPKQKAQAALRAWCKTWSIVLSANVAASLAATLAQAIEDDRREVCPACAGDVYKCADTPSRHCDMISRQ